MVTPSVEPAEVKNFCNVDCAVTASCTVSDCRMKSTATRAKSSAWSETEKVELAAADVAVVVAELVAVVSVPVVVVAVGVVVSLLVSVVAKIVEKLPPEVVRGSVKVLTTIEASVAAESRVKVMATPDMIVTVTGTASLASTKFASTSSSNIAALLVVVVVDDSRVDDPSKVTRAFSATHERLFALNLDRIVVAERGMEKFICPSWTRRGMAWPSVTLLRVLSVEDKVVVVHPSLLDVVQSFPVKPLVQMQEQTPSVTTFVPPLAHVICDWQSESSGCAVGVTVSFF